jgi:hypothetical protein
LLPPLSRLSAPSLLPGLRAKREGFHLGAADVKRLAAVDAAEPTVEAKPMGARKSIAFAMGAGNKFHLDHRKSLNVRC